MAEQFTRLDTQMRFGKVLLETDKLRKKFHLPAAHVLYVLDTHFSGNTAYTRPLVDSSDFVPISYNRGARYTKGETTYVPGLLLRSLVQKDELLGVDIETTARIRLGQSVYGSGLNPNDDTQMNYILNGFTDWPPEAVAQRIGAHESLVQVGQQLIQLCQSVELPGRDLSTYTARKIIG